MSISAIGPGNFSQCGGYFGFNHATSAPPIEAAAVSQPATGPTAGTAAVIVGSAGAAGNAAAAKSGAPSDTGKALGSSELRALKRSGAIECQTCKSRTYQDVSGDPGVSFKSPGHIDPASSGAVVMSHEQEHVSNARASAASNGSRIVSQSVRLFTSVCPECGRVYVSGGETRTVTESGKSQKLPSAAYKNNAAGSSGKHVNVTV